MSTFWLETILPRPLIAFIASFFEVEEQFMMRREDTDTIGPFVTGLPPDILKTFAIGCARKNLQYQLTWAISRQEIVWAAATKKQIAVEAARCNHPRILAFAHDLGGYFTEAQQSEIYWSAVMSGSTDAVCWLEEKKYVQILVIFFENGFDLTKLHTVGN